MIKLTVDIKLEYFSDTELDYLLELARAEKQARINRKCRTIGFYPSDAQRRYFKLMLKPKRT